jgi:radical SAM protein with 4Fe4S-binding SPASM domain
MSIPLFRIGLIVTFRCNAECRHCFFEAGPNRDEVMSLSLGLKAIDEAAELGVEWVSLTGGEPFLETELLENLVEHANHLGLNTEIVTNGYWATTPEKVEKTLEPLVKKGLNVLNLSLDDFHQEYVSLAYVRNAFDAALSLKLRVVIMTTINKNNKITAEIIPRLLRDPKIQVIGTPKIREHHALLIETPITPAGRAEKIPKHEYRLITSMKCDEALRDIGIGPKGEVYPCCGPLASKVTLGNVNDSSLRRILEDASDTAFFKGLKEGVRVSGAFTSKCHACLSLDG